MAQTLAILGTNQYNIELVRRAKRLGYETHIFGIEVPANYDVQYNEEKQLGATKYADHYHKISVVSDKEKVLDICKQAKVSGVVTMGGEAVVPCIAYLAEHLGLAQYNSQQSTCLSTNKLAMKNRFKEQGIPTTDFIVTDHTVDLPFSYPVVVKSIDRAGKFGITKVKSPLFLEDAINYGLEGNASENKVLVEKCASGKEWTVEAISYAGQHHILTFTEKWSGPPHFVEEMHLQPAPIPKDLEARLRTLIPQVLDALEIKYGPSHTELRVDENNINIIEVAARIVADNIWQCMLISTGMDWIQMMFDIAIGKKPDLARKIGKYGVSKFIMSEFDHHNWQWLQKYHANKIVDHSIIETYDGRDININGKRYGNYIMCCDEYNEAISLTKPIHWSF